MTLPVLVPYVPGRLQEPTRAALDEYAPGWVGVEIPGDGTAGGPTDFGYGELLAEWWQRGEPFILIEQDIVIHDRVIAEFEACDEPWCSFPYNTGDGGRMYGALGCIRFGAELLAATAPDAPFLGIVPWYALDQVVQHIIADVGGIHIHNHWPIVGHVHNQHGPDGTEIFEDTRDETDIRRPARPETVTITHMTEQVAHSQRTGLGGMLLMGTAVLIRDEDNRMDRRGGD